MSDRPCTCHPSEAPKLCQKMYALGECQAADEIARLRAALKMWQEAVRVDAKMEGPVYMGVSSTLGRKAWEATRAAITGGNDADT